MKHWLMVLLLALPLAAQEQKKTEEPPPPAARKLFILKYADANKVKGLLEALGANASPNSDLHALAVSARPELMPAIEDAIKRLDVPAAGSQNIELTAYFLIGGDADAAGSQIPKDLDSVVAQLKNAFPFKTYRLMDTLTLRTRSGFGAQTMSASEPVGSQPVTTNLNIGSTGVSADGSTIRIDRLKAGIRMPFQTAPGQFTYVEPGLNADVDIKEGQKVVVGRLSMGHDQALFLVLTARVVN
jgi:hypothetical protein